jgi:glycosyltransferase involved in cell wall biosynthesis
MKVLNVVDGSGWTGGVEQALLLCRELRGLGVDARLAAHGSNPVLAEALESGVPALAYDEGRGGFRRAARLMRILGEGYDVVVAHKPGAVRHVFIPRLVSGRRTLLVGVRRVSFAVSPLTVYRFPKKIVAVAENVREVLVKSGIPGGRISVIRSGVDLERFRPDEEMRRNARLVLGVGARPVLLNLAKFVPGQKGQRILMEAASLLKKRMAVRLLLAGLETDSEEARGMVRAFGLDADATLLGFRRDIPELINASDIFVFPSLPGLDAIAGSVLQAMACGRVAVASAVGGIPEYIEDGVNGFLVTPGDARQLCDTIQQAINLPPREREEIGRRARETVCSRYSTRSMAEDYLRLFKRSGAGSSAAAAPRAGTL